MGKQKLITGLRIAFGVVLILLGAGLYLYPSVSEAVLNVQTDAAIAAFDETYGTVTDDDGTDGARGYYPLSDDSLYLQCLQYNVALLHSGQANLVDAFSYESMGISLTGIADDLFGYIEIPSMDVTLPLYLGASEANMAKGATVLGQTSLPIGGNGTNCVIAAHRGYRGSPYFREIERISIGDLVYITNPWGTLVYRAVAIDIISPHDVDAIKIQEGKDMVTLLTCHPYRSHGKQRYVVYCERTNTDAQAEVADDTTDDGYILASDGNAYATSSADIAREDFVRRVAGGFLLIVALLSFLSFILRGKKQDHE